MRFELGHVSDKSANLPTCADKPSLTLVRFDEQSSHASLSFAMKHDLKESQQELGTKNQRPVTKGLSITY